MASIQIVKGEGAGAVIRLGPESTIGRNPDTTIPLQDTDVSRRHAIIRRKDSYFVIMDCGSANGTRVNGHPLERLVPQPLYDGDKIRIGTFHLAFVAEGEEPPGGASRKKKAVRASLRDTLKASMGGGLTMVLTSGQRDMPVNATIDAGSAGLLAVRDGQEPAKLHDAVVRLQAMVKVSQDLGVVTRPEALLEKIMDSIFDLFPHADRAFIMLRDRSSGDLAPAMGRTRGAEQAGEFPVSKTVIKAVVEKKQSILTSDAQQDGRFAAQQSIVSLAIRSMMCVPFICKDELLGIISVDTRSGCHAFSSDDLALLTSIAGQAAIAIKNAELYATVETETQTRTQLARYLSPDVVEGVLDGTIPLTLGGERKHGTVLFCDIVGFTALSERLGALEVVDLLNKYFRITTAIITRHRGTLHKFGGDMIMAFWNVMFKDDNAQANAIRAGIEMQSAVWEFGGELAATGQPPIHVGIGCNTGEFAGGNIGGDNRMEYTVIGDNVNLAQRIESKASRWQVFVAQQTYEPAARLCSAILLPPATVKGKSAPIHIYSIRGILRDDDFMLLSVPVSVECGASPAGRAGLLTGLRLSDSRVFLRVGSDIDCAVGGRVTCTLDCPELIRRFTVSAIIAAVGEPPQESPHSRLLELDHPVGAEALALLKPGGLEVSQNSWDEMSRH